VALKRRCHRQGRRLSTKSAFPGREDEVGPQLTRLVVAVRAQPVDQSVHRDIGDRASS
jgi:hypothetical protein